jgi:transcriptional regulator EpsA
MRNGYSVRAARDAWEASGYPIAPSHPEEGFTTLLLGLNQVSTREGLVDWCSHALAPHLPHEAFVCCLGRREAGQGPRPITVIAQGFPAEYLQFRAPERRGFRARIVGRWLECCEPILADTGDLDQVIDDPVALESFHASQLRNIICHGMHDYTREHFSHYSFYRIPEPVTPRHGQLLELLAPALHAALVRIAHRAAEDGPGAGVQVRLSPRELEILAWIAAGKTNDEIAQILGTRFKTVKNQVQSILVKLRVNNRAQAVAKATRLGLQIPRL